MTTLVYLVNKRGFQIESKIHICVTVLLSEYKNV